MSITWITNPANGHEYAKIAEYTNWTQSEQIAQSFGGHLVSFSDQAENDWIKQTFIGNPPMLDHYPWVDHWCWTGLYEVDYAQRTWAWSSGEPVNYTNWASGEPSGYMAEHWMAIDNLGLWRDLSDDFWYPPISHISVAEREPTTVPEAGTVALFVLGLVMAWRVRRRK